MNEIITSNEIKLSQEVWGNGVVEIGAENQSGGDAEARARRHVDELYNYQNGPVLFKPTMTVDIPFRDTPEGAVSYFVGGNSNFPEDHGFAIKPWSKVRFENSRIIEGPQAIANGMYYFTGPDGSETPVVYTFGYVRDNQGQLRINVHHSSLLPAANH